MIERVRTLPNRWLELNHGAEKVELHRPGEHAGGFTGSKSGSRDTGLAR